MAAAPSHLHELRDGLFWRDVVAELVASFILLTVQCSLPLTWGGAAFGQVVQVALGMGIVVMGLVEVFGPLGGGHFNPAVTVSMLAARKISIIRAAVYIIAQCAGAIFGTYFIYGITPVEFHDSLAATTLHPDVSPGVGVVVEAWLTMMLVLVIYGTTNPRRTTTTVPSIPIGLTLSLAILAGIKYTGASLNPARSLGPAIVMNIWQDHWVYWIGPVLGGLTATIVYHFFLDRPNIFLCERRTHSQKKTNMQLVHDDTTQSNSNGNLNKRNLRYSELEQASLV